MMADYMLTADRSPFTTSLDQDASTAIDRSNDAERLHQPPLRNDEARHQERCIEEEEPSVSGRVQAHLLATKFFVPASSRALIPRPHLDSLLHKGIQRRLTLVSAPAGFGKTTLLANWVHSLQAGTLENHRVAWVSLDEADKSAVRFWTYVLTALEAFATHRI